MIQYLTKALVADIQYICGGKIQLNKSITGVLTIKVA